MDKVEHEGEAEEGLDLERGLWASAELVEGQAAVGREWLVEVDVICELEDV